MIKVKVMKLCFAHVPKVIWVLTLLVSLQGRPAWAQTLPPMNEVPTASDSTRAIAGASRRPKIGLVLSGGSARGLAHIGVLEWFEQHRIPVDYLAGTSMGGLVGGMYATGMTPKEMRAFVDGMDWDAVLSGTPAHDELTFRRKEDRRSYQTEVELGGLRNGLEARSGLNPGHRIGLILDRLTLPYTNLQSFDDLPIPFRCVATDMLAARPVILDRGSLPQALRATMSLPGIFTPVEIDGKVLADGGLLNNIPTDVAKQMGADVIIAVNVGTPLGNRKTLDSLFGVLLQSISIATIENDRRSLRQADVIVAPDLENYTLLDFNAAEQLADLGYKGAEQKRLVLEKFAINETEWQEHLVARRARMRDDVPAPAALEVAGADRKDAGEIRERLEPYIGRPLAPEQLEEDLTLIIGEGRYDSLGYEYARRDPKRLVIRAQRKPYGPPFLIPSVEIDGSDVNRVEFILGGRLTMFDVGGYGSELRTDVKVGSRTLLATEYYHPFRKTKFFVAPRAFYERGTDDLYLNRSRVAEYQTNRYGLNLDIGFALNRESELRLGYDVGYVNSRVRIGDPLLPALSGGVSSAGARYAYDGQDSAIVPTRGVRVNADARWFFNSPGAVTDFPLAEVRASGFVPLSERGSLFVIGSGGTSFTRDAPPAQQFTLGGPFRLGAYGRDEFRGSRYVLTSLGYLRQVSTLPPLFGDKIYAGSWYEFGGAFNRNETAEYFSSLSGGVIVVTKLGPIGLGGSVGEGGRRKVYFSLGKFF